MTAYREDTEDAEVTEQFTFMSVPIFVFKLGGEVRTSLFSGK